MKENFIDENREKRILHINVNTNMYIFARLRMYKITRFPRLNDALIGMNHQRL